MAARPPAGAKDVISHLLQSGAVHHRRIPKCRDNLVFQQPADLKQRQREEQRQRREGKRDKDRKRHIRSKRENGEEREEK